MPHIDKALTIEHIQDAKIFDKIPNLLQLDWNTFDSAIITNSQKFHEWIKEPIIWKRCTKCKKEDVVGYFHIKVSTICVIHVFFSLITKNVPYVCIIWNIHSYSHCLMINWYDKFNKYPNSYLYQDLGKKKRRSYDKNGCSRKITCYRK